MRSSWLPLPSCEDRRSFSDKTARRDFFRKNNTELPLQQQYIAKLEAAGVRPRYLGDEPAAVASIVAEPAVGAVPEVAVDASSTQPQPSITVTNAPLRSALAASFLSASSRAPVDWSSLPAMLVPGSHMRSDRALRKQDQLQNMIQAVRALLEQMDLTAASAQPGSSAGASASAHSAASSSPRRPVLVDFCCSSGHLGFPLAWLFPDADVILVEHNATAVARARHRLAELRGSATEARPWTNLRIAHTGLQSFHEPFDLGIGLHACGWLSDVIQLKCAQHRAAYLLAPCCIGKLKLGEGMHIHSEAKGKDAASPDACCSPSSYSIASSSSPQPPTLHYPRSTVYSSVLSRCEYLLLASKADYSDSRWDFASAASNAGSRLKSFIEWDRICAADESGYVSLLAKMQPQSCTPKNDLVFGLPRDRCSVDADAPHSHTQDSRDFTF